VEKHRKENNEWGGKKDRNKMQKCEDVQNFL
jgi:hypothetical protein